MQKCIILCFKTGGGLQALVECEGESIDLSGDLGSVGRVVVSSGNQDVLLDLKGIMHVM